MILQIQPGLAAPSGCTWGAWWHLPAALLLTYLAILAHELTHAVAMWPISERVRVRVDSIWMADLRVESTLRDEPWRQRWADVAGIAPLLVALCVLAGWLVTGTWPDTSTLGLGAWNALLWFGFLGGAADYSRAHSLARARTGAAQSPMARALPDGGQAFIAAERRLVNAVLVALLAALLAVIYQAGCHGSVAATGAALAQLALLLAASAIGLLLARLEQFET